MCAINVQGYHNPNTGLTIERFNEIPVSQSYFTQTFFILLFLDLRNHFVFKTNQVTLKYKITYVYGYELQ